MAQRQPHTLAPARCVVCGVPRAGAHNAVGYCATCNAVACACVHMAGTVPGGHGTYRVRYHRAALRGAVARQRAQA